MARISDLKPGDQVLIQKNFGFPKVPEDTVDIIESVQDGVARTKGGIHLSKNWDEYGVQVLLPIVLGPRTR
jgi:hypothetical protein